MHFPRLPDWSIYAAVVGVLVVVSLGRRENADTPPPAPTPFAAASDEAEGELLGPVTAFDAAVTINTPETPFQPSAGTAFSVAGDGRWITARHVVEGCRRPALIVGDGQAVSASVRLAARADIALLLTDGGPAALPLARDNQLRRGQRGFHPGFPQGRPGEVASRLLGRETLQVRGRGQRDEPILSWAEVGRTKGLEGTLAGLSGAPTLDSDGRVVAVTIAESPRRGRIYTTAPDTFGPVAHREQRAGSLNMGKVGPLEDVTTDNYGRVANGLRRDLRVAQVVCLST